MARGRVFYSLQLEAQLSSRQHDRTIEQSLYYANASIINFLINSFKSLKKATNSDDSVLLEG
jgi:hypothetical protein